MLEHLAQRCWASPWYRAMLFALLTVLSILFMGYYFGTFDQAIHIPFLKKIANPALYPNDPFFDLRFLHYSFFWYPFVWLYEFGVLEISLFVVYVLVIYMTFWALWQLSVTLFNDPLASLLSVVAFVLPHAGFASFTLIEFSLLNRTFVLPFLLVALNLYLRERRILALFMLGVLYNLHVVSVNFVLAMVLFDCLLQLRRIGWRTPVLGMIAFVLAASPVLLWRLSMPSARVGDGPQWEWFSLLSRSYFYHLFYLIGPYPHVLLVTLGGIATIVIFFVAQRLVPRGAHDTSMRNFVIASLIVVAVQVISSYVYPVTLFVQAQIMRAGVFVMIFAYLAFANYLAFRYRSGQRDADTNILTAAMVASPSPAILLAIWGLIRAIRPQRIRQVAAIGTLLVLFFTTAISMAWLGVWRPGIEVFPRKTAWTDVQFWARDNTPIDAVFITPPEKWWFFEPEWRVLSERSTVVTLSELLEIAFAPSYTGPWQERFAMVAPGAEQQLQGDSLSNNRITAQAFYTLTTADLERVARRYHASYLVMEKPNQRDLPVVYQNQGYTVYRLDPNAAP